MAKIFLRKAPSGSLIPADECAYEAIKKLKAGEVVRAEITRPRNLPFHKKFFALISFLFDIWEESAPRRMYQGQEVRPNIDRFRRDLIILSGRFDATYNVRGDVRLEAKSISFANMPQDEFERLYSEVINVALSKVLNRPDLTEEKIREHCEALMAFD